MRIILASQSLFRKHALDVLGVPCEQIPSHFDESSIQNNDPHQLARLLAEAKARKTSETYNDALIIAADLFIVHNDTILGKPKDNEEAKSMLEELSDFTFDCIAGLAVYNSVTKKCFTTVESCTVRFRKLLDAEIDDYISRYPVTKCAAAFEDDGLLRFAESISGNYNFRAGLPVNKLILFLRENGVKV